MVQFSPVCLSIQDAVRKERTIKVSVAEMAFPHLPWNFDMTFRRFVFKCSSNFLGGLRIRKSNVFCQRITWLPSFVSIACNIYLVLVDHSIWFWLTWSNPLVLPRFSSSVWWFWKGVAQQWYILAKSFHVILLQTKNATLNFPRRISCMYEIKHTTQRGKQLELLPSLGAQHLWQDFYWYFSGFVFKLLATFF